ncbi:MAG: CidA/LrgA family protein [Alphaproteobacteria bacterium]|nr:CidA/LrgA family protein [Alphaproteobacteria bacterium]
MNYLVQFLLLMLFVFAGEVLYAVLPLPIPGSIYGLVLLLLALRFKVIKLRQIEGAAGFFIAILPVLFVVPAVGIIDLADKIRDVWILMFAVVVGAYTASMASTGWFADFMIHRHEKKIIAAKAAKAAKKKTAVKKGAKK